MKTYINPITRKTLKIDIVPSSNGNWFYYTVAPNGTLWESEDKPEQEAFACFRACCNMAVSLGYFPLWAIGIALLIVCEIAVRVASFMFGYVAQMNL